MKQVIKIVGRKITLGKEACWMCTDDTEHIGLMKNWLPCPNEKQRRGKCEVCGGTGRSHERHKYELVPCYCATGNKKKGTGIVAINYCSSVNYDDLVELITKYVPVRIVKSGRPQTFNEAYLGSGSLTGVTDYGRTSGYNKTEMLKEFYESLKDCSSQWISFCKRTKKDNVMILPDVIDIIQRTDGWSAYPKFKVEVKNV